MMIRQITLLWVKLFPFCIIYLEIFQRHFSLNFTNAKDLQNAKNNLIKNFHRVQYQNQLFKQRKSSFSSKIYDFHWKSDDEILNTQSGRLPQSSIGSSIHKLKKRSLPQFYAAYNFTNCVNLPAYKNWVDEGKVISAVQNQFSCNDCYIFSAVGTIESAIAIKYGTSPLKLSEQNLVECIRQSPYG